MVPDQRNTGFVGSAASFEGKFSDERNTFPAVGSSWGSEHEATMTRGK